MRYIPDIPQLKRFLKEDLAGGDVTSEVLVPRGRTIVASIFAEEPGILCGIGAITTIFRMLDRKMSVKSFFADGKNLHAGDRVMTVRGDAWAILSVERTVLNLLQQLSGTATLTSRYVDAVRGTSAVIYDTRKTIPGMRHLQKYAVRCGGGSNHRMNLAEAVLIKDNHLFAMSRYDDLHAKIRTWRRMGKIIEIETENSAHLSEILALDIDIIMLDNFELEGLKKAVACIRANRRRKNRPAIEVSGGVGLKKVRRIACMGVERIAIGAITHSAPVLNFTLECQH